MHIEGPINRMSVSNMAKVQEKLRENPKEKIKRLGIEIRNMC
jgi:hypothetical protein